MSLSIGIIGLPNVGKSTLFNALLKRQTALVANYPFATIEPNIGIVDVPDSRLEDLAQFVKTDYGGHGGNREVPERIIPSVIKFYDIAGLVKGASQGEGLGNAFLSHIREVDAIVQVVRDFKDSNIIRAGSVDPKSDAEIINTELVLADLQVLDKRLERMGKEARGVLDKNFDQKRILYLRVQEELNKGKPVRELKFTEEENFWLQELNLLTAKKMLYVINVDEADLGKSLDQFGQLPKDSESVLISAKIEAELAELPAAEREAFMSDLGITEPGLNILIRKSYELLELQDFLTAGPKEVRAWTIKKGTKAPQAAAKIHTDFEKGFIAAELINFTSLKSLGSWKKAKEVGAIRLEGKEYVMADGDVVEFRINL